MHKNDAKQLKIKIITDFYTSCRQYLLGRIMFCFLEMVCNNNLQRAAQVNNEKTGANQTEELAMSMK